MIDKFLYKHPVFRFDEFAEWKKQHSACTETAIYQSLNYYLKIKKIIHIKKGLYGVIPPNQTELSVSIDPYLIAAKASKSSILAFHTAMELYGIAYTSFQQFYFISEQKVKPFEFSNQYFQPVILSKKLYKEMKPLVEIKNINRQGIDIKITTIERTFVDILDRIKLSGGWEEVIRALEGIGVLNIDRVINYSLILDKAVLNAKVGWYLEQRKGAFAPTKEQLLRLLANKPKIPCYIGKINSEPFKLIKKWNILIPLSIINKSWEEPFYDS